ncbi:unnamed protein product [Hymenolepis diminuta]|uniref:Peptidase M12B domain-containing protein n=1 Tax=Hymenolepis diminuta TaxID=6216 RepID=A0A0R3SB39_HYMDI|nr:unnamed protein product [Hymenolepis diminuta]
MLSGRYSDKLYQISSFNNFVNSTFSQTGDFCKWAFNSTHHIVPTLSLNSTVFFNNEQQINRLKRLNGPKSRRIVRVFHRPGENAPYIVELYVVTDEKFISSFSHDIAQVVTRVNNIFKVVNSLFSRFNVQFVIVGLEIWEKNRVNLEAEDHFLRTLASFKRTEVNTRHDCLFAILGDDDQTSTTRGRANSQVMCKYSSCVSFVRVSRFT